MKHIGFRTVTFRVPYLKRSGRRNLRRFSRLTLLVAAGSAICIAAAAIGRALIDHPLLIGAALLAGWFAASAVRSYRQRHHRAMVAKGDK